MGLTLMILETIFLFEQLLYPFPIRCSLYFASLLRRHFKLWNANGSWEQMEGWSGDPIVKEVCHRVWQPQIPQTQILRENWQPKGVAWPAQLHHGTCLPTNVHTFMHIRVYEKKFKEKWVRVGGFGKKISSRIQIPYCLITNFPLLSS